MFELLAINALKGPDIAFFVAIGVIIALCVLVYFLIPVFNRRQYHEQRENLKLREAAFKANIGERAGEEAEVQPTEATEPAAEQNVTSDETTD